jgi:hypothetical protein
MRLISNDESVARGEVSILAIIETLLAIALVFYLSTHFNTVRWLAIAMCVSPLLLLRTEESTRLGIKWWDWWMEKVVKPTLGYTGSAIQELVGRSVGAVAMVLGPPMIRMCATVVGFVTQPGDSLGAIPRNWIRVVLATDSHHVPEVIPGHEEWSTSSWEETGWWFGIALIVLSWIVVLLAFCFFFLPAFFYRWSLKATSIIYAPLVFVAHSTFSEGADLRTKLELIKRGDLSRIRVWYGVIAIAAFVVKLVFMMNLPGFAKWWNGHPILEFAAHYVAPSEIPKWQLAELANSALAIGSMLFARHALLRYELQHPLPEAPVKRVLGFVSGLRWVLALCAIACTAYITMRAAQHWHWPALGEKWVPWGW